MPTSDQFDPDESLWPRDTDDLLDTSGPWTGHALLDWQRGTGTGRMEGFRRAAEVLVGHVLQRRGDLDFLFYPIANCWRHHIELQLKSLVVALNRLLDAPAAPPRGHDVMKLWDQVRPKLATAFPKEPPRDAENVDRVLRQLHAVDPDGQNFRYHRRTDGSLALPDVDRVDIRAWHGALIRVSNYLDGAAGQVSYHQEMKDDLKREAVYGDGP